MHARHPTPAAKKIALRSHPTVAVIPTAAEASALIRPTIAESTYMTTVCSACSMMVGQASIKMVPASARSKFFFLTMSQLSLPARQKQRVKFL